MIIASANLFLLQTSVCDQLPEDWGRYFLFVRTEISSNIAIFRLQDAHGE